MKRFVVLATLTLLLAVVSVSAQKTEQPSRVTVEGEMAVSSSYPLWDLAGQAYKKPTAKMWIAVDYKLSDRCSVSGDVWLQRATASRRTGADEYDLEGSLTCSATKKTSLTLYGGTFQVNGLAIRKVSVKAAHDFTIGKQPVTLSNTTMAFRTSRSRAVPGGFADKLELSTAVTLPKKFKLSGSIAASVDNGPFHMGGPAAFGFLKGRIERPISEHFGVFLMGRYSFHVAGTTTRTSVASAEAGLSFHF